MTLARGFRLAAEALLLLTLVSATLLQTPRLADNILGKTALVHLLGGLTVLAWGACSALGARFCWPRAAFWPPFVALTGTMAVAVSWANNTALSIETVGLWCLWLLLGVCGAKLVLHPPARYRLTAGLLSLMVVVSGVGLLQAIGYDLVGLPEGYEYAPLTTLANPNFVAQYLEVYLPLCLTLGLPWIRSGGIRALAIAAFIAGLGLLVLSGSRGAWLGTLLAGIALVAFLATPRQVLRHALLSLLVIGLASPVVDTVLRSIPVSHGLSASAVLEETAASAWDRALSTFDKQNFSRAMRLLIWRDALHVIEEQPWLGVGPGHFGLELMAHRTPTGQREWRELMGDRRNQPYHAHNEFLEVWAETGVVGVVALIWLLGAGIWYTWRLARTTEDPFDRALVLGCMGGLVAATVHAMFSFNLRDPVSGTHLWVLCGLAAGIGARQQGAREIHLVGWRRLVFGAVVLVIAGAGIVHGLGMLRGDVYFLRGQQRLAAGHPGRALLEFRRAAEARDHEFSYHHWQGQVALDLGRADEAAAALRRSLERNRNNPGAARLLARALLQVGQPAQAIEPMRHAIAIDALTPANYSLLADVLRAAGQGTEAATARRQAISLDRGNHELLLALSEDLRTAGHLDSAIVVLAQTVRVAPGNAIVVGNLGALQVEAGQLTAAEANLRRAIALEPGRADWHGNLALALAAQRRFSEAVLAAAAAVGEAPDSPRWQQLTQQLQRLHRLSGGEPEATESDEAR
jgi:O-antigen ligase/tetratricopeptide (TPR) repeat protein